MAPTKGVTERGYSTISLCHYRGSISGSEKRTLTLKEVSNPCHPNTSSRRRGCQPLRPAGRKGTADYSRAFSPRLGVIIFALVLNTDWTGAALL